MPRLAYRWAGQNYASGSANQRTDSLAFQGRHRRPRVASSRFEAAAVASATAAENAFL